ncbi:MAG TPA: tetratricopeptide repeat protein [bacterium]|jgi:tetratricopeptide (TPR) repeat protein
MSLGTRIRELRQSRGLTQTQLGGTDLSKSFISLVERDRTRPSVETLTLISRRLGTSVDGLLGQEGRLHETAAESLLTLSREAAKRRELDSAVRLLDAADYIAQTYGIDEAARESSLQRANILVAQRKYDDAWPLLERVKATCEQTQDHWRLGRTLLVMARYRVRVREFPEAISLLEHALTILKRAKASRDPARVEALILLGTALTYTGGFEDALKRYEEAASSDVAKRETVLRGRALWGMGLANRKLRRYDRAREHLVRAKDAMEQAEELPDLMRVLQNIGQVEMEQGRHKEALRHLHHALRVADRIANPLDRGSVLTDIGRANLETGNLDEAELFAQQSLAQSREVDPVEMAEAQTILAKIRMRRKDPFGAARLMKDALAIFKERGMQVRVAQTARELGLMLKEQGALAEAADFLAIALESAEAETAAR